MTRWAMVIDLRKCVGCGTCCKVCMQLNNVPSGAVWRRLIEREMNGNSKEQRLFLTMSCMHCDKAPCLEACPTGATYRRPDGIIDINYELCVGCGSCIVACPYHARSISYSDLILPECGASPKDRIGICTKCNFCLPRIDAALEHGLKPGVDSEATPACVRYCIAEALHFGDLNDPDSKVSRLLYEHKTVRLQEKLGTNPSVYYILK